MKMIEIEKIAARKFVEIKGNDYLDSSKYTMSKCVTESIESNEIKFEFFVAKARPKIRVKLLLMRMFHGTKSFQFMLIEKLDSVELHNIVSDK